MPQKISQQKGRIKPGLTDEELRRFLGFGSGEFIEVIFLNMRKLGNMSLLRHVQ